MVLSVSLPVFSKLIRRLSYATVGYTDNMAAIKLKILAASLQARNAFKIVAASIETRS